MQAPLVSYPAKPLSPPEQPVRDLFPFRARHWHWPPPEPKQPDLTGPRCTQVRVAPSSQPLWQWPPPRCPLYKKKMLPQPKHTLAAASSENNAVGQSTSAKRPGVDLFLTSSQTARLASSSDPLCQRSPQRPLHESQPSDAKLPPQRKNTSRSTSRETSSVDQTASVTMRSSDLMVPCKTPDIDFIAPSCEESRPAPSSLPLWQRSPSRSVDELPRSDRKKLLPQPKHTLVSSSSERSSGGKSAFVLRSCEFPTSTSRSQWRWPQPQAVRQEGSHSAKEILPQPKPTLVPSSRESSGGEQSASAKRRGVDLIALPSKKARVVSSPGPLYQQSPPQLLQESQLSDTKLLPQPQHTSGSASRNSGSMSATASVTMRGIDSIVPSKTIVIDLTEPPCAESRPAPSSLMLEKWSPSHSDHELPRSNTKKLLPQSQPACVPSSSERVSSGESAPSTGRVIDVDAVDCSKAHLALSSRPLQKVSLSSMQRLSQPKVPRGSVALSLGNRFIHPGNLAWMSARPVSHPPSNHQSARDESLARDAEPPSNHQSARDESLAQDAEWILGSYLS